MVAAPPWAVSSLGRKPSNAHSDPANPGIREHSRDPAGHRAEIGTAEIGRNNTRPRLPRAWIRRPAAFRSCPDVSRIRNARCLRHTEPDVYVEPRDQKSREQ